MISTGSAYEKAAKQKSLAANAGPRPHVIKNLKMPHREASVSSRVPLG